MTTTFDQSRHGHVRQAVASAGYRHRELPPPDSEAELWTLGAALVDPSIVPELLEVAPPELFLDDDAAAVARAVQRLHDRGDPIDVKLLLAEIDQEETGSARNSARVYLASIAAETPTAAHWRYHAQRVADAAKRRQAFVLAERLAVRASAGDCPADMIAELLEEATEMVDRDPTGADPWATWHGSLSQTSRQLAIDHAPSNSQLRRLEIGPGQVTLLGGKPGAGKTALAMQVAINAIADDDSLRVLVANCEMDPGTLLDRQLARASKVSYGVIRDRTYAGDRRKSVYAAGELLLSLRERLMFMGPPFTMPRVRALAASHRADLVVIDYLQRFKVGDAAADQRLQVSDAMTAAREIAMTGPAVLAVSALSRAGEFRESSEIEYGADSGFILERGEGEQRASEGDAVPLIARCIKNRHGELADIELTFDGRLQEHKAASLEEE